MRTIYIKKSTLRQISVILIILILDFGLVYTNSNNIEYSSYELELVNKYNDKKLLVLTFDDGPSKYTSELLDILQQENIKATFFLLGNQIPGNEALLVRQKNEGHIIGIHSYEHVIFTKLSEEKLTEQVVSTKNMIYDIINITPNYIRVPYGIIDKNVENIILGLELENILWNVDSLDWNYKNAEKTVKQIINKTTGNDIILMHDTFKSTNDAVKQIIPYYKEKGYIFVTIPEFYRIKNIAKSLK